MSARGTSGSSYSIILPSQLWVASHTPFLSLTHTHAGVITDCSFRVFFFLLLRSHFYLLDPLAPGPAEALEDVHCHLTRVLWSQRAQQLGHLHAPSASAPPGSAANLLSRGCFETSKFPPRKHAEDRRECSWTGRKPSTRDLQPPPSLRSLRPDRLGYVTDCCVIASDQGFRRALLG